MKHECDIVRDLMPMVVDGTASEKSKAMVEEHVAECAPCRDMLDEMRQDVVPEAERQEDTALVRKLRGRRRVRTALLVLLGMALVVVGWRGWNYCFNDYCVLTAEENYSFEVVEKGYYSTQTVLTIRDGHAQSGHVYFDREAGDLYLWSTTTRIPVTAASDKQVNGVDQLYHFMDIGYGYVVVDHDGERGGWYCEAVPVGRIIKGAPDWYMGAPHPQQVIYELIEPTTKELAEKWQERMEAWGVFDRLLENRTLIRVQEGE